MIRVKITGSRFLVDNYSAEVFKAVEQPREIHLHGETGAARRGHKPPRAGSSVAGVSSGN